MVSCSDFFHFSSCCIYVCNEQHEVMKRHWFLGSRTTGCTGTTKDPACPPSGCFPFRHPKLYFYDFLCLYFSTVAKMTPFRSCRFAAYKHSDVPPSNCWCLQKKWRIKSGSTFLPCKAHKRATAVVPCNHAKQIQSTQLPKCMRQNQTVSEDVNNQLRHHVVLHSCSQNCVKYRKCSCGLSAAMVKN